VAGHRVKAGKWKEIARVFEHGSTKICRKDYYRLSIHTPKIKIRSSEDKKENASTSLIRILCLHSTLHHIVPAGSTGNVLREPKLTSFRKMAVV
jgi:hypothetical protein